METEAQKILTFLVNERKMTFQTIAALLDCEPSLIRLGGRGEKPLTGYLPMLRALHASLQAMPSAGPQDLDVNEMLMIVSALVDRDETAFPLTSLIEFESATLRRAALKQGLTAVLQRVKEVRQRIQNLPKLPERTLIHWAQALMKFPNLAFLAVDTTGLGEDADLIRLTVVDGQAQRIFDQIVQPQRQKGQANTAYTGITKETLAAAPSLVDVWPRLLEAMAGRYVLGYNQEFLLSRLRENATYYQLEEPVILVEDLMLKAEAYFGETRHPRLADVCRWISQSLPSPATALDRALGQRAVLHAMSEAKTNVLHVWKPDDDLDDHPF